jgi:hypothetical protein
MFPRCVGLFHDLSERGLMNWWLTIEQLRIGNAIPRNKDHNENQLQ